jgi:PEP-CTERM motif
MTFYKYMLASAVAVASATAVLAAPIVFTGDDPAASGVLGANSIAARTSFLANLSGGVGTENFDSLAVGTSAPFLISFPGSTGNLTASIANGGTISDSGQAGAFATSGSQYLFTAVGVGGFVINFATAISAFGFYGTDLSDSGGDFQIELTDSSAVTSLFTITTNAGGRNGSSTFWGFVDPTLSYTSIRFINTGSGESFGFDDFTIGDQQQVQVPEPMTVGLMGVGLLALGIARRRRRS